MAYERLVEKLTVENLWLYILRLLQEKPLYGYEIRKQIQGRFNFAPAIITVYVVLYKLQREGLVKKVSMKGDNSAQRKYYAITNKGTDMLEAGKKFFESTYQRVFS